MIKKILIVGGTGFIGGYLREHLLNNNHDVDFTSRSNNFGIKYDALTDELSNCVEQKYDYVINNINPQYLKYHISVKNDESLIQYCKKYNSNLIQISSLFATEHNKNINAYNLKKSFSEELIKQELDLNKYTILRFPQVFDEKGQARASQKGMYYLLESVKKNVPISVFSNYVSCSRNYLPIEVVVDIVQKTIEHQLTGTVNGIINSYTISFMDLVNLIVSFNPGYDIKNISVGENVGLTYFLEDEDKQLVNLLNCAELKHYLKKAYNFIDV
jgi:nucleoside-diphosphate-sugar epimerase